MAEWSKAAIADFFRVSPAKADAIIKAMLAGNLIERSAQKGHHGRAFYRCGYNGSCLRNALLLKPISRAKGEILVKEFLLRVAEVNANEDLPYAVRKVLIFGSYIECRHELGDIDLAIELRQKLKEGVDWIEQLFDRADQSGKRFRTYLDRLTYAHREIIQILKAKCPYIAIHRMDDLKEINAPSLVIFKECLS